MEETTLKISARHVIVDSSTILDHASIIVHNGKVDEVGPAESLASIKTDRTINLKNHIIHPGFINAHSHLELSFLKGKLKPKSGFGDWAVALVKKRRGASDKKIDSGIKLGVKRMLESGTTTVGDITFTGRVTGVLKKSGIRAVVFHEMLGYHPGLADERFKNFIEKIKAVPGTELVTNAVSPHAVYSTSPELIKKAAIYARRKKIPISMHLCETKEEVEFSRKGSGPLRDLLKKFHAFVPGKYPKLTPVNVVVRAGALKNLLIAHLNHPARGDLDKLKKANAKVVVCPNCGHWFGRGIKAPVYDILDRKIPLALGTDSLASNYDLDMAKEAHRLIKYFPDISLEEAFNIATFGGACALGLPKGYGTLAKGAPFDAVSVRAGLSRRVDPIKAIMSRNRIVDDVWVAGNVLYRNRKKL